MRLLVVEDNRDILANLADYLALKGYEVDCARDGLTGLHLAATNHYDLIVLDVMLPGMDGFALCRELRARGHGMPVLMLTARSQVVDKVVGLKLGADDYLTKPFSPRTLLARVRAVLRRAGAERPEPLTAGAISLDLERRAVVVAGGAAVRLTPLEARLLHFLLARAGETVPAERLLLHVWGGRLEGDRQALKQLVHRLRQKLEPDPAAPVYLVTEAGEGYRLEPSPR